MQQTHSVTHGKSLGIGRICMLCSKQSIKPECVRLNNFYNEAFRTVLVYSHNIAPHFHNAYLVNLKKKPFTDITPVTWFGKLFHNLTDLSVKEHLVHIMCTISSYTKVWGVCITALIKVKLVHLIQRHLQYWTEVLYNLGSGSWLALAAVPWRKLAAAHSPC